MDRRVHPVAMAASRRRHTPAIQSDSCDTGNGEGLENAAFSLKPLARGVLSMKLTAVGKLLLFLVGLGLVVLAFVRFVPAEDRAKLLDRLRGRTSGAARWTGQSPQG